VHYLSFGAIREYAIEPYGPIIAQAPKMAPDIPLMREHIAADLGIVLDCVNVKATTEKMGFEGCCEGISSMAVAFW